MKRFQGGISNTVAESIRFGYGVRRVFSYVGNLVSLEQAIAVLGLLSPGFIELEGHVFWLPDALQYDPQKFPLKGLVESGAGGLEQSSSRRDVERYRNVISIDQFFSKWEGSSEWSVFKVGLPEEDYRLCHLFAEQITRHWTRALSDCFPEKVFRFEIADDPLDEFGVCLTFWQP